MCYFNEKHPIKIPLDNVHWFLIEEYRVLRAEILQTMSNRNIILTFSFATLGAIVSATVLVCKQLPLISYVLIVLIIPTLITFYFILWMNETRSIIRIATYIKENIETRAIYGENDEKLLGWENWLSTKNRSSWEDKSRPALLVVIFFQSLCALLGSFLLSKIYFTQNLPDFLTLKRLYCSTSMLFIFLVFMNYKYYSFVSREGSKLRNKRKKKNLTRQNCQS